MSNTNFLSLAEAEDKIRVERAMALGEALRRLQVNPDFKQLILEGYCKDEALALVGRLAIPGYNKDTLTTDLTSISSLLYYFQRVSDEYEGLLEELNQKD